MLSLALATALLTVASGALAEPAEPTPSGDYRELRSDYVRTWYVYNDEDNNGILNPGDINVGNFNNWWTTVSSGTQYNYSEGPYNGYEYGDDRPGAPMNHNSTTDAADNYWLPTAENSVSIYMTYSQMDNHDDFSAWGGLYGDFMNEQHGSTDGWALGWVTNAIKRDMYGNVIDDTSIAGTDVMDVFIHNGRYSGNIEGWGMNHSNPQVTMSNDISLLSEDPNNPGHPYQVPRFDEIAQAYNMAANTAMEAYFNAGGSTNLDAAILADIVASMELYEVDPYEAGAEWSAIYADKTPEEIITDAVITALAGGEYTYDDAFLNRGTWTENSNDGGVIGGLGGQIEDTEMEDWADQQVIRMDFSELMLAGLDEIVIYDFGDSDPGSTTSDQVNPIPMIFGIDHGRTAEEGQIFWEDPETFERVYFADNRLYIAQTIVPIPEPATLSLLGLGSLALLRRRRNRNG
jgi:hypothetical protein